MHDTLRLPLGAPDDVPSHVTAMPVATAGSGGGWRGGLRPLGRWGAVGRLRRRSVVRVLLCGGLVGWAGGGVTCGAGCGGGCCCCVVGLPGCSAVHRRATRSALSPVASSPLEVSMACSSGTLRGGGVWVEVVRAGGRTAAWRRRFSRLDRCGRGSLVMEACPCMQGPFSHTDEVAWAAWGAWSKVNIGMSATTHLVACCALVCRLRGNVHNIATLWARCVVSRLSCIVERKTPAREKGENDRQQHYCCQPDLQCIILCTMQLPWDAPLQMPTDCWI